jgi:hypothetical protein
VTTTSAPPAPDAALAAERLLRSQAPDEVLAALRSIADVDLGRLAAAVEEAVGGLASAAERYVEGYRDLLEPALELLAHQRPDLPLRSQAAALDLLWSAAEAAFSGWVAERGAGEGVALHLVDRLRAYDAAARPLPKPPSALPQWELSAAEWLRFHSLVEAELRALVGATADVARLRELFDLTFTEVGELFGASRQAATKWLREGLPAERREKAATIVALGELLERKLRTGRLPAVARRPAAAYGGRSMLDRIAADEHHAVLDEVRASFDWAATA